MRHFNLIAIGLESLLVCAIPAASGGPPEVTVEPVTLLSDGRIAGCGMKATARTSASSIISEVIAFRENDRTVFSVRARPAEGGFNGTPWRHLRLTTATHDTRNLFPQPQSNTQGYIETRAHLPGFTGSSFAQELLVTGGRFEITAADQSLFAFDLPHPVPHGVRQAYLNCAGDLFRPEHE